MSLDQSHPTNTSLWDALATNFTHAYQHAFAAPKGSSLRRQRAAECKGIIDAQIDFRESAAPNAVLHDPRGPQMDPRERQLKAAALCRLSGC